MNTARPQGGDQPGAQAAARHLPLELPAEPRLAGNIVHFARALRRVGLRIGPGRVIDAVRAVEAVGFTEKHDFYNTLAACFVSRPEERLVFAQVFRLYWRDPRFLEHMMAMLLPSVRGVQEERRAADAERRAAEALLDDAATLPGRDGTEAEEAAEIILDASGTASATERLRQLDFEQMSTAEMAEARRLIERLRLPVRPILSRRTGPDSAGRLADWRATLRLSARRGGEVADLRYRARRHRWPDLVALCDISGSMSQYSRAVLHLLHALANAGNARGWGNVHAFTFGTRLTNVSRHLRRRDVDAALRGIGSEAEDWEGGTRIGATVAAFNRDWSRRLLAQGGVVVLLTDGLDRGDPALLEAAMERLHLTARRVIWVNPLLRWEGFSPRARGIRTMLRHVDSFRAGHNVASLEALCAALGQPEDGGEKARLMRLLRQ